MRIIDKLVLSQDIARAISKECFNDSDFMLELLKVLRDNAPERTATILNKIIKRTELKRIWVADLLIELPTV